MTHPPYRFMVVFRTSAYQSKSKLWAVLASSAATVFLILTLGLIYGTQWRVPDTAAATWSYGLRGPALTQFMLLVSTLNSNAAINVYSGLIISYLFYHRAWQSALWFFWIVQGGLLLNVLLKHSFSRARPSDFSPLLHLNTYSFPSGHVTGAMLFYGVLVFAYAQSAPPRHLLAALSLAILLVVLTAASRVYLGVHYPTDVIAGWLIGLSWALLCWMAERSLDHRAWLRR